MTARPGLDRWLIEAEDLIIEQDAGDAMRCRPVTETDEAEAEYGGPTYSQLDRDPMILDPHRSIQSVQYVDTPGLGELMAQEFSPYVPPLRRRHWTLPTGTDA